ncbi:PC-Esterase [Aphelenchoides avenae]|nr:PC-Esterase [Aphelenchus avenae]
MQAPTRAAYYDNAQRDYNVRYGAPRSSFDGPPPGAYPQHAPPRHPGPNGAGRLSTGNEFEPRARPPVRVDSRDIPRVFSSRTTFPYDPAFVRKLFCGLHVVFIGDSMSRALYKDLITLLDNGQPYGQSQLVTTEALKKKMEYQYKGDHMIVKKNEGDSTTFIEVREYCTEHHLLQFFFTTRAYKEDLECIIAKMRSDPPDVVFMQSCIWDVSRYYRDADPHMKEYAARVGRLCRVLSDVLLPTTTFVWLGLPPAEEGITSKPTKGFMANPIVYKYTKEQLNYNMRMANSVAAQIVSSFGFDVCDMVPHFDRREMNMFREPDGVHFNPLGTRIMTQFIVAHLVDAWGVRLPKDITRTLSLRRGKYSAARVARPYETRPSKMIECQRQFFKFMNDNWEKRVSLSPLTSLNSPPIQFLIKFLCLAAVPRHARFAITEGKGGHEPRSKKPRMR